MSLARATGVAIISTVGDKLEILRISSRLCIQKGYRGSLRMLKMKIVKKYLVPVLSLVGGVYFLYSGYMQYQLTIVEKRGIEIQGRIVSYRPGGILSISSDKSVYRITYTYKYRGKSFTSTERILRSFFPSDPGRSAILIKINPDSPQYSMIKGNYAARSSIRIGYSDFLVVPWYINPLISLLLFAFAFHAYRRSTEGSDLR